MPNKKVSQLKTKKINAPKKAPAPISEPTEEKKISPIIIEEKPKADGSIFWWSFEEKKAAARGLFWYVGLGLAATALLIFAILQKNYLFLLFIILAVVVYYLMNREGANRHIIRINNQNVSIDSKTFPHEELKGFGYLEKHNGEYLIFETSSFAQKYILVPLKKDKEKIVEFLKKHLPQKEYEEGFLDTLEDFLKF